MLHAIGTASLARLASLIPAATWLHASALRLDTTTRAPCSARRSAIALPMPFVEPVTRATFPVRSKSVMPSCIRARRGAVNDQHRAPGMTNDLLGDRAHQHAGDSGVAMTAHHDEIERAILLEHRQDLRPWAADTGDLRDRHTHLGLEIGSPAIEQRGRSRIEAAMKLGWHIGGARDGELEHVQQIGRAHV